MLRLTDECHVWCCCLFLSYFVACACPPVCDPSDMQPLLPYMTTCGALCRHRGGVVGSKHPQVLAGLWYSHSVPGICIPQRLFPHNANQAQPRVHKRSVPAAASCSRAAWAKGGAGGLTGLVLSTVDVLLVTRCMCKDATMCMCMCISRTQ